MIAPSHSPSSQMIAPHELPELTAYAQAVYIDELGVTDDPEEPGFTRPAMASQFSFDVMLNIAGGGATVCEGVGFSNPVPSNYKIRVRLGERVFVNRTGRLLEFCIPWIPYVKPCSTTPGAARGGSSRRRVVIAGTAPADDGGGSGVPVGGTGSGSTEGGTGSGSAHGGGSVPP